jgi:ethanolamine utilization cobalamin adenosyltransferase
MKFITEEDLRERFKKEPFTEYKLEPGTRITPGARQFLMDRGIQGFEDAPLKNKLPATEAQEIKVFEIAPSSCSKRLLRKMKWMEALLLYSAQDLLNKDVLLAQKIIALSKSFTSVYSDMSDETPCSALCFKSCTGINMENLSKDLGDCFEITEFHIQLVKGREIIVLHKLRCALREIEEELNEFSEGSEAAQKVCQIINTLSQLICVTVGGEKCQKKM